MRRVVTPMITTIAIRATPASAVTRSLRLVTTGGAGGVSAASGGMRLSDRVGEFRLIALVQDAENDGYEHYRCEGCKDQTTDDGATKWRILLAAFAKAQRHRRHPDDHGERGHQHGAEAHEAGLDCGLHRVAKLRETFARERNDQHAVRGRDTH